MLTGMDIPVTAGPWLVLGVVLGVLLPVLVALGVLGLSRGRSGPEAPPVATPPPAGLAEDDLPAFLESPPGSAGAPGARGVGWAALCSPVTPPPAPAIRRDRSGSAAALAAMVVTALVLIGAAAAVATARTADPADARGDAPTDARGTQQQTTAAPHPRAVSARLTFGGVVLERHAVGVTVAYPRVQVTTDRDRAVAEVELVTFNCLRDKAPGDPVAAACTRSVPEHAELSAPELRVETDGGGLWLSGRFATVRRPNGSPPVSTGRIYELTVRVVPRDGRAGEGQEPATGLLELGEDRVGTSDEGPNEITYGG
jgi:hypothetical protein